MSYANFKSYELRYSDFDFRDALKPSALLSLVQESAAASADELGFGYKDLKPLGLGFITVATHCAYRRPVVLGDVLTIETWPLPPRHVIFERDYRVTNARGEEVAVLASRWCLVDLATFTMLPPERMGEAHARCPYRAEKSLEVTNWRLPRLSAGREVFRHTVRNSDCDHYLHANNAKYFDFFLDCFSMQELGGADIRGFQIAYAKQTKEDETLIFTREDSSGASALEARGEDGTLRTQFKLFYGRE